MMTLEAIISPLLHMFFHVSHFLPANYGAVMWIKCCILPLTNIEKAKASGVLPQLRVEELTSLPQTP